jgi:hypothetical protein
MRDAILRTLHCVVRDEAGSELVEFAVSVLVLLMLCFGIIDVSRAMYAYHFVSHAAQEGSRYAIVRGADWKTSCATSPPPGFTLSFDCTASTSDVQNYVRSLSLPGIDPSQISVTTTWPGTTPDCNGNCATCSPANSQGCIVNVKIQYPFSFLLPFLPKSSFNFTGSSQKVVQY